MSENLVTYDSGEGVARIGLNDPKRSNALSIPLVKALNAAIEKAETDESVKTILLFGHGRGFCAGGDLKEFYDLRRKPSHDFVEDWTRLYACDLPVIVAIHGYAIGGGCEISLMGDYAIASRNAVFSQPELGLGFTPGCGATKRLPEKIGYGNAFDMIASGKRIIATDALNLGLVNEVVNSEPTDAAFKKALAWGARTRMELIALKRTMRAANLEYERETFYRMVRSPAAKANIGNFLSKPAG